MFSAGFVRQKHPAPQIFEKINNFDDEGQRQKPTAFAVGKPIIYINPTTLFCLGEGVQSLGVEVF